ncbi:DUF3667 domain-containing protein [Chryseobacterium sp. Ch-15]|uniref:DUF3667 domain-containing protein n=1 Tax=Chryseobacterium muglaense TaxID=2893752 RepID=A0A9Q3YTN7_9FLAO|nr:DUF3667 domain-containing protein [Chryseobacterium muglaense]MBD3905507.1 DUF3667 domain-containing protein [Chryseobacterium muglaense]MCC9035017.1 DUF3667 domain-containing protein [Chryseobacterium muglaense]MCC9037039.1 DUF3667 domain-containing protein [Chryseobacterium muglaense]MCM2555590.1 DUF3667 domain-containing protein [Chryseobacterium muglaense]
MVYYIKGIWYSIKQLYLQPGHAIRDYIEGKRINHFKPLSLVIVLATVYALIYHLGNINLLSSDNESSLEITENIFHHYYWFVVATTPLNALATFLFFKKTGYNYSEMFILESFKTSQRLLLHILSLGILFVFNSPTSIKTINYSLIVIDLLLIIWSNIQFFKTFPTVEVIIKSLLSFTLYTLVFFVILVGYDLLIGL